MGLIDDLNKAAEAVNEKVSGSAAIYTARLRLGVEEGPTYGNELLNVLTLITERIGKEYVPVPLDAEGEPVECLCEYYGADGTFETVVGYRSAKVVMVSDEDEGYRLVPAETLTKNPPDTQERIDEDKRKRMTGYWGCSNVACDECPAMVEGKKPYERYGISEAISTSCSVAMGYDLALRQARLDGRA